MKFEDIKAANETIVTTDVKGKQYAEVNQRIKAFRMCYPEGTIKTEIVSIDNGVCIMKADIIIPLFDDAGLLVDKWLLGTGTAYEKENSTFINKTSYIENCETSAVGRALAMCGFGIDTSIASKEEVENAIQQQEQEEKELKERMKLMADFKVLVIKTNTDHEKVYEHYGITSLEEMENEQIKDAINTMKKKVKE